MHNGCGHRLRSPYEKQIRFRGFRRWVTDVTKTVYGISSSDRTNNYYSRGVRRRRGQTISISVYKSKRERESEKKPKKPRPFLIFTNEHQPSIGFRIYSRLSTVRKSERRTENSISRGFRFSESPNCPRSNIHYLRVIYLRCRYTRKM